MSSKSYFILPLILLVITSPVLHSQSTWGDTDANPMQIGSRWGGFIVTQNVTTVVVDAIDNALPEVPGSSCNGEIVTVGNLTAGIYIVGIIGGPGLEYHTPATPQHHVAFFHNLTDWPYSFYGGLFGIANPSNPMTYHVFVSEGNGDIDLYITDDPCSDNAGYVVVAVAKLGFN